MEITKEIIAGKVPVSLSQLWGMAKEHLHYDLTRLDTSKITTMYDLFYNSDTFNQDISKWDTSSVVNTSVMFSGALSFNQAIGSWDTSKVTDMREMFKRAKRFNQDLSGWDVRNVRMYNDFAYSADNYKRSKPNFK